MSREILALAFFSPVPGQEKECLAVTHELIAYIHDKCYGRDLLLRDTKGPNLYLDMRWWASEDAGQKAHSDLEIHKYWARLGKVSKIKRIYERLDQV